MPVCYFNFLLLLFRTAHQANLALLANSGEEISVRAGINPEHVVVIGAPSSRGYFYDVRGKDEALVVEC